jgi:hypothetical protein
MTWLNEVKQLKMDPKYSIFFKIIKIKFFEKIKPFQHYNQVLLENIPPENLLTNKMTMNDKNSPQLLPILVWM